MLSETSITNYINYYLNGFYENEVTIFWRKRSIYRKGKLHLDLGIFVNLCRAPLYSRFIYNETRMLSENPIANHMNHYSIRRHEKT